MTNYLSYNFHDSAEFVETYDELPLWSASFGLLLLKYLELKPGLKIIDLGSGSGFPLMELAARLGNSCKLYGIDPWTNANERAKKKIKNYNLSNVEIIQASADKLPFENDSIDLIVSNLGINNFNQPELVFKECFRVLKNDCKLVLTTNLNGHWKEFYSIFEDTLKQLNKDKIVSKLIIHQKHRGNVEYVSKLFTDAGFKVSRYYEESFTMRFLDGSTFLNHYFVKLGWLESWRSLLPENELESVFLLLETNLNNYSLEQGELSLTVPMLYMEGIKN